MPATQRPCARQTARAAAVPEPRFLHPKVEKRYKEAGGGSLANHSGGVDPLDGDLTG